jgi:hypothetical protein
MKTKNHDYSRENDALSNFKDGASAIGIHPVKGLLLRVMDKIGRINSFCDKGELKVENEGVEDAFMDILNYMVLGVALVRDCEKTETNTRGWYFQRVPFSYGTYVVPAGMKPVSAMTEGGEEVRIQRYVYDKTKYVLLGGDFALGLPVLVTFDVDES